MPVGAKVKTQPSKQALTVEQEQQFAYYWYSAHKAITEERYADGLALLEFCRWIKPDDGTTLSFIGTIYQALGQKERALGAFKEAFDAAPRDQWYKYSMALLELKNESGTLEALRVMEKAYDSYKAKDKSRKSKSRKSKVESRKTTVDENLLEQLKRLYINEQQWKKALKIQDEIDNQKGYDAFSAITRYRIYAASGKPKKAIAAIDKYLELDPTDLRFLLFRLELMEYIGVKQSELYAMYEKVLHLDPYNLMVLNNYAYHLATHGGDIKEAERMSAMTIREQPDNPVYLDTYGWILHLQGQDELAKFYLHKALQVATDASRTEITNHLNAIK